MYWSNHSVSSNYVRFRKSWRKLLLDALKKKIKKGKRKFQNIVNYLYSAYPDGFYVYGNTKVRNEKAATAYVGRYTVRPAIADSRILSYDGENVTFYYDDHKTKERIEVTISAIEFIKKVIIHIANRQFKMIRYYGIYANRVKRKCKVVKMVNEKIIELKKKYKSWRKRIQLSFGHDPLECAKCGETMILTDIYYPKIGSVIRRAEQRAKEKIDIKIYELEENYEIIKKLTSGEIEPLYI